MKMKSTVHRRLVKWHFIAFSTLAIALLPFLTGCQTAKPNFADVPSVQPQRSQAIILMEGDTLKISFPGTPNLDTVQQIRRDGKIALPLVGEVVAAGKTPGQLEKELIDLYAPQLVSSQQVTVAIESSTFPIFVTGAVMRPGKVLSDHPMTLLEAIMESGGFDFSKANLKAIKVLRNQEAQMRHYTINLKGVMKGSENSVFYLKPYDIIYVPEKFSWF